MRTRTNNKVLVDQIRQTEVDKQILQKRRIAAAIIVVVVVVIIML